MVGHGLIDTVPILIPPCHALFMGLESYWI